MKWIVGVNIVVTDKTSGVKNNPGEWDGVKEDPRCMLDLQVWNIEMES